MFQRLILSAGAAVVAACAAGPGPRELSQQCAVKYREEVPPGTTVAKPIAELRPSIAALRDNRSAYACVAISVDERGKVTGAKLLETDTPQFGEYFLKLTSEAKYMPGSFNGSFIATRPVISMAID